MVNEESKQSPQEHREPNPVAGNGRTTENLFSPRFKSVAAMAGWDEEAILVAALVVEDTPERESKQKRRFGLQLKTPPSNSRRKRRVQKRSPVSIPIAVLDLDEEESSGQGISEGNRKSVLHPNEKNQPKEGKRGGGESSRQVSSESNKKTVQSDEENQTKGEKRVGGDDLAEPRKDASCSTSVLPCIDKLKEELSCAICLEICFEPSTTTCGHSFCKKCLRSAAEKCGKKCPKCRQLISNGRSCTVNTVLWNTIQLLFPQEVEARKAAAALNSREAERESPQRVVRSNARTQSLRSSVTSSRDATARREVPSQDEDAASTLRLGGEYLPRLISSRSSDENQNRQRRVSISSRMRRRGSPSQDEDAALALRLERENLARLLRRDVSTRRRGARVSENEDDSVLALRLQREEFMEAFGSTHEQDSGRYLSSARANLRAMASRAINVRLRGRPL